MPKIDEQTANNMAMKIERLALWYAKLPLIDDFGREGNFQAIQAENDRRYNEFVNAVAMIIMENN